MGVSIAEQRLRKLEVYFATYLLISWPATMWGPAIVIVRVVRLSVCHTRISPKLSEINIIIRKLE